MGKAGEIETTVSGEGLHRVGSNLISTLGVDSAQES